MITPKEARRHYTEDDSAHGFEHVLRVWRLAERIGREEGADMALLQAAALLHDLGRPEELRSGADHAEVSARCAAEILAGHPPERVAAVAQIIREHRYRVQRPPSSLEAKVLFDADKLDAIGAIGVARAYAVGGAQRQRLWARVEREYAERLPEQGLDDLRSAEHTPVHEYVFKLSRLVEGMYTPTGKRLAEGRAAFMAAFFQRLEEEISGLA